MSVTAAHVTTLRGRTRARMTDCKRALIKAGVVLDQGVIILREPGLAAAGKRSDRATGEGMVSQ